MQTHCDLCGVNVTDQGLREDWRNKIVVGFLKRAGLVAEHSHLLTWIGPR